MTVRRPDPDELLARVQIAEQQQSRGKLKIFFGAAAGVGKTYAMLEAARTSHTDGIDVVVGWVETHGRAETAALLEDLERIPPQTIVYRGTTLHEFDLDAALARHPALLLLDELAHTNVPGSRHSKRWQDAEELLAAGIDVYTTVNVQHIESLSDVVAQITEVIIRETVPDTIIDQADEIEVIDLTPDELLERLHEGKVYVPQQARQAVQNFFRKGNLIALRELALRRAADRIDTQMQNYRRDHAIAQTWPTTERLLVAISPSPSSRRLVRATLRMAQRWQAPWLAVYVEPPAGTGLSDSDRSRVAQTLTLAEQLGAEVVTLSGHHAAEEVLSYARTRNVSRIVVGKPVSSRWREWFSRPFADAVVRGSGDIDVFFTCGEADDTTPVAPSAPWPQSYRWPDYGWACAMIAICTGISIFLFPFIGHTNVVLIYLLGITALATRFSRRSLVLASLLSVAVFNFFFTTPYYTLQVDQPGYLITFVVMLTVALVTSTLTVRIREQAVAARQRERRTAALYAISQAFAVAQDQDAILEGATEQISSVFGSEVVILLPDEKGRIRVWNEQRIPAFFNPSENGVAQWVYDHGQPAGQGTDTLPSAAALYVPLLASQGTLGVLGVYPTQDIHVNDPQQRHLLATFTNQTALALERAHLAAEAQQAQLRIETEQLRNSLLSSVSHDLRTPLASITGAASSLLEDNGTINETLTQDLLMTIHEEAERLSRLVQNLLEMTRIETGTIQIHKEWQPLEEVIGAALTRLARQLDGRSIQVHLPADLPLVPLDGVLIEQVLINILDNALKYTPPGSPIELAADVEQDAHDQPVAVVVTIADRGPGLPPGVEQGIFDKFFRIPATRVGRGAGLGLTICRAMIEAHGGRIWAANRSDVGAIFHFTLPLEGMPPLVDTNLETTEVSEQL